MHNCPCAMEEQNYLEWSSRKCKKDEINLIVLCCHPFFFLPLLHSFWFWATQKTARTIPFLQKLEILFTFVLQNMRKGDKIRGVFVFKFSPKLHLPLLYPSLRLNTTRTYVHRPQMIVLLCRQVLLFLETCAVNFHRVGQPETFVAHTYYSRCPVNDPISCPLGHVCSCCKPIARVPQGIPRKMYAGPIS